MKVILIEVLIVAASQPRLVGYIFALFGSGDQAIDSFKNT